MSYFRTCYQCGKGTMVRYATDEAICSECIDNPVSIDELSFEKLQERCDRYEKNLATAVEALTRIKFNGLFKKAGPHGDYAPYNVATQTKIAEQALAEIGGEDE